MFEKPFEGYELLYRLLQDKVEKHEKRGVCLHQNNWESYSPRPDYQQHMTTAINKSACMYLFNVPPCRSLRFLHIGNTHRKQNTMILVLSDTLKHVLLWEHRWKSSPVDLLEALHMATSSFLKCTTVLLRSSFHWVNTKEIQTHWRFIPGVYV